MSDIKASRIFIARVLLGIVIGSILSTTWFHLSSMAMPGTVLEPEHDAVQTIYKALSVHVSIIALESVFVLLLFVCVGLPLYFVASKVRIANIFTAMTAGFALGMLVSVLYGGPDLNSLRAFTQTTILFGIPGVIAGISLWYSVKCPK